MQPEAAPRWRRRKQERPREIIAAALDVFSEKGFAAARLDDIAARAGVSKGALYLYFETKEDLFRAVVTETVVPDIDAVEAMVGAYEGDFATLARMVFSRLTHVLGGPTVGAVAKMVIGESRNFPAIARVWHDALAARGMAMMAGVIARAQARGEVKAGDPRAYAVGLIGALLMSVLWRETFVPVGAEPIELSALATQHLETILAGMLTEEARP